MRGRGLTGLRMQVRWHIGIWPRRGWRCARALLLQLYQHLLLHSEKGISAGKVEYRILTEKELVLCKRAAMPCGLRLKDADMNLGEALHKKGLLYRKLSLIEQSPR